MWSDRETEIDALNVGHVVAAIVEILESPVISPVTIGVFGPWGIGKSSVVRMVQRTLEAQTEGEGKTLVIYFNGWRFEGYEDARSALMNAILEGIASNRTLKGKAEEIFASLAKRVDLMALLKAGGEAVAHVKLAAVTAGASLPFTLARLKGAFADAEIGDVTSVVGKGIKEPPQDLSSKGTHRSVSDFDKDFEELLKVTNIDKLVVIIDDLDRCLPSHVIDTLEAIRLFLSVDKTSFVISADETLIHDAVRARFPANGSSSRSLERDYLEKMIQVPIRLPLMGRDEIENYINLLMAQLHLESADFAVLCRSLFEVTAAAKPSIPDPVRFGLDSVDKSLGAKCTSELKEALGLAASIVDVVALSVEGNPRQVKRYLNALFLRLTMARKRGIPLSPPLAAKLMVLEYFKQGAFLQLGGWQATQDGMPRELSLLEDQVVPSGQSDASDVVQDESTASVENDLKKWLDDEWLRAWLSTQPRLGGVSLGAYFYLARDRSWSSSIGGQRLGPAGEQVLTKLYEFSAVVRLSAKTVSESLPVPVVLQIFSALAQRARSSGKPDQGNESPYSAIYDLLSWRPEIAGEVLAFIKAQPIKVLKPQTPAKLVGAMPKTQHPSIRTLLQEWADQTENQALATAAEQVLADAAVWG